MPDLLLELFSEEIPARMQARAAEELSGLIKKGLDDEGLAYDAIEAQVAPRRLMVAVTGLPEAQEDRTVEKRGPKVGAPEQALEGFLRSCGVDKSQLEERHTGKDTYYYAVIEEQGKQTAACLKPLLEAAITKLSWQKSMRWGAHDTRWVRPLHAIVALFNGNVIPMKYGHIEAGNTTYGHRFMAPDAITVTSVEQYKKALGDAKVMLDRAVRRTHIEQEAVALAKKAGHQLKTDTALLEEVSGLVEWPVVLSGEIEAEFMPLPPEVLTTAMRSHQKYFATEQADGTLAPQFIFVANIDTKDNGKAIIHGNQRVLRARLADAAFFWEQDRRTPLEARVPMLDKVVFHAKLGSLLAKSKRIEGLAKFLAVWIPHASLLEVGRTAKLCKADLVTDMVGEFAELQGLMGRYYALEQGEPPAVADAIRDHYAPQGPGDACPSAPASVAVALADKMDTLAGLFAADELPTGSKDPYALRRAALGIIRIIRENGLRIPLSLLIDKALLFYPPALYKKPDSAGRKTKKRTAHLSAELLNFMADRLRVLLRDEGYRHDTIAAIFDGGQEDDCVRLVRRVDELQQFLSTEDGENLLTAYRRAANILKAEEKKDDTAYDGRVDKLLLKQAEEKELLAQLVGLRKNLKVLLKKEAFAESMQALSALREPVDAFFEGVTVNDANPELRRNRLLLLALIRSSIDQVANFALLEGGQ